MTNNLSPDGNWWWNGSQWVSAVSPDWRWRWDGSAWVPNQGAPAYFGPTRLEPTEATRKVQLVVVAFLVLQAALGVLSATQVSQSALNAAFQSMQDTPGVDSTAIASMARTLALTAAGFGLAWNALLVVGTILRWRWIFYALMVLGALALFGVFTNALDVAGLGTVHLPLWLGLSNIGAGLVYLGLAVWLFTLWRRYQTAWASAECLPCEAARKVDSDGCSPQPAAST